MGLAAGNPALGLRAALPEAFVSDPHCHCRLAMPNINRTEVGMAWQSLVDQSPIMDLSPVDLSPIDLGGARVI